MKWILLAWLALSAFATSATELPLEYFTKHGDYLDMKLSPDGKHIAARVRYDSKVILVVLDRTTLALVGGVRPANRDIIHTMNWVNEERLVFEYAEKFSYLDAPIPTGELFGVNIDGSKQDLLYGFRAGDAKLGSRMSSKDDTLASQEILSFLESDDKNILIIEYPWTKNGNTYYDDRSKQPVISKLNVYNGRKRKVDVLPYGHSRALANKSGSVNFMSWEDNEGRYHSAYREDEDSEWTDLGDKFAQDDYLQPLGASEDQQSIFLGGRRGEKGIYTLFSLDLNSGEYKAIFDEHDTDIEHFILDKNGIPAVGITYPGKSRPEYAKFESETSSIYKLLADAFGDQTVRITSRTKDWKTLLVHVSGDVNPGEYYLFDSETLKAEFVWANSSWIDPRMLAPMKPIMFETSDGMAVNGYLTLPTNLKPGEKPPLVVMIHGGPHQAGTRDFWRYDPETQLLANRGYSVLRVNFRGSDGYGTVFERAGYKEWGGKMIQDINEATQWVIDKGYVDGDNICAYGASYGGYAALMSVVRAPDLYKCTIGYVGIYDMQYMFTESDIPNNWGGQAYLSKVLGNDQAQLHDYSPINHVDKIKASVMLIHGSKDRRVPEINAEALSERLTAAGKPPVYLQYKQAGHGVYDEENRRELYQGLLDFLDTHLKS